MLRGKRDSIVTRMRSPTASVAAVLLVSGVAILVGCGQVAPEPATTTPTAMEATASASPAPAAADPAPASTGTRTPAPAPIPTHPSDTSRGSHLAAPAAPTGTPTPTLAAPTGTPTPTLAAPTATVAPRTSKPPASPAPARPSGNSAASTRGPESTSNAIPLPAKPTPTAEPNDTAAGTQSFSKPPLSASSDQSVPYTWQDGARTGRAFLQPNLVVQQSADNSAEDVIVRAGAADSIVERTARHDGKDTLPVFHDESGSLMTLPGGVLLVLDEQWGMGQVNAFFASNGIAKSSVEAMSIAPNAFFIETAPGLPSLNLANALAAEDGVQISSPNWRREVVPR